MSDEKLDTQIRRRQIAEAALALVSDRGLARLSVAAVARRVGLVPSGVYRHFQNKGQIVAAVLKRVEDRLHENVQRAREEVDDPIERLHILLVRHLQMIREGRAVPRIIFSDELQQKYPECREQVLGIVSFYLDAIAECVRQGQQEGCIRAEVDPQTAGLIFLGIIMPAGLLWHLTDGGFDVTRHTERAWRFFAHGLRPEKAGSCCH
jgi:AcrR family transcriptional regulator